MVSQDIPITDCHHHLWSADTHSWLKSADDPDSPVAPFKSIQQYLLPELLADIDSYNITKSVYLQCLKDGDPVDETKWAQTIADSNPKGFPHGIVSNCDLTSNEVLKNLTNHMKYPNFRGIRHALTFHPVHKKFSLAPHDKFLTDLTWQQGFSLLSMHNLTFDFIMLPHQYTRAYDVIKANPTIPVVINHCGMMFERDEATMKLWRDGLTMLASLPNCYMKLSGLQRVLTPSSDLSLIKSIFQELIGLFGTDRCMYASNFPVDKISATYKQVMEAAEFSLADYTLEEKKRIFADNANKFYRL